MFLRCFLKLRNLQGRSSTSCQNLLVHRGKHCNNICHLTIGNSLPDNFSPFRIESIRHYCFLDRISLLRILPQTRNLFDNSLPYQDRSNFVYGVRILLGKQFQHLRSCGRRLSNLLGNKQIRYLMLGRCQSMRVVGFCIRCILRRVDNIWSIPLYTCCLISQIDKV